MNQRAKFDSASFILAVEIRNRTNKKHKTNSKRYIHTLPIAMCGLKIVGYKIQNTKYNSNAYKFIQTINVSSQIQVARWRKG